MKRLLLACLAAGFLTACQDAKLPTDSPDAAESPDFKEGGKKNKKNIHAQINAAIKQICPKPRSQCSDPKSAMFDAVGAGDYAAAQAPASQLANIALAQLATRPELASAVEAFLDLLVEFAQFTLPPVTLADALASPSVTITENTGVGLATPENPVVITSDPGLGGGLGFAVAVFDDGAVNEPLWVFVNSPQDLREQDCHPAALVGEQTDGCSLMDVFPPLGPEEEFANDVIIAVCLDFGSPLAADARLYRSDGPAGTFAQELVAATSPTQLIEDCDDPQYSSAGGTWLGNFASSSWRKVGLPLASALLPKPLEANTLLAGISGSLGGRTRKFSNFGWAVPLPAGPDLIIQSIELSPEDATSDDDLTFTVTVENIGDGPADPSELLLEIGEEVEGEGAAYIDFFITAFAEVGALFPGATEEVEISEYGDYECEGPCPINLAAGDYIARATANVGEEPVDETDEENNTLDVEFAVSPGSPALLEVTVQPSDVAVGAIISPPVEVTLRDSFGDVSTGATNFVTLAISGPGTLLGTPVKQAVAGVATFDDLSVDLPGVYTLDASSAPLGPVAGGSFVATAPNLQIQSLTHSPGSPTEADIIVLTAVIENTGTAASGPSTLELLISGETPGSPQARFNVAAIAAGATAAVRRTALLTDNTYTLTATADVSGAVTESNEADNTGNQGFTVASVSPIFKATFNNEIPGSAPSTPLGPEVGTWALTENGGATARVRASVGPTPAFGLFDQPLELARPLIPTGTPTVNLVGTVGGALPTTGTYVVRWQWLIDPVRLGAPSNAVIRVRNSAGAPLVEMRQVSPTTFLFNGVSVNIPAGPGLPLLFELTLNLGGNSATLNTTMFIPGSPGVPFPLPPATAPTRPFLNPVLGGLAGVSFILEPHGPQIWGLDNVLIY